MQACASFPVALVGLQIEIVGTVLECEAGILPWHELHSERAVDEMPAQRAERFAHTLQICIRAPRIVEGMSPA